MSLTPRRATVSCWLVSVLLFATLRWSLAQSQDLFTIPSLFKFDAGAHVDSDGAATRFTMDRFKLFTDKLSLQYSTQAPTGLAGRQFQAFPPGYALAEFTYKKGWGTIQAFRSTRFDSRILSPVSARKLTGFSLDVPKAFEKAHMSAYLVHGSPESRASSSGQGIQFGLAVGRDFGKVKLQSELSGSSRRKHPDGDGSQSGAGLFLQFSGDLAGTSANVAYRLQDAGLSNPAAPSLGRGLDRLAVDMRRKFRRHEFQFTGQREERDAITSLQLPSGSTRQEMFRWSYSPKILPQISAAHTRSSESTAAVQQSEDNIRLSANKGLHRLNIGFSVLRGIRIDDLAMHPLWETRGFGGDAAIEYQKNRKLNVHYESNDLALRATSQLLSSQTLQLSTRTSGFGDKCILVPAMDYRVQRDNRGTLDSSFLKVALAALLKLPRRFPGTDLTLTINAMRLSAMGRPNQSSAGLLVQWNFKPL